jgi:hypothetical protein
MIDNDNDSNKDKDEDELIRIESIVGNDSKGIKGVIPISRSGWWNGVKTGRFPAPVKLSARVTCWRRSDIKKIIKEGI